MARELILQLMMYKEEIENLDFVKRYYGYSNEKAKQVLNILTREQLSFIRDRLETGGRK